MDLAIARGSSPAAITKAAVETLGGMGRFVKPGSRVVIKPNLAFPNKPEYAATANPEVVGTLVALCMAAGAGSVTVFDNPVSSPSVVYDVTGIKDAVEKAGGKVVVMSRLKFVDTAIPNGKAIKKWPIYEDVLKADVLIDVPIAKHHNLAGLTMGIKNLMGAIGGDRSNIHSNIGQSLADLASAIPVHLTVIDAVRILVRNGPTGGNLRDVEQRDTIIASSDIVAADAYGATLFGKTGADLAYIKTADAMGLGKMDYKQLGVREVRL